MKTKILSALKTKYANLGFNAKALDGVASVLEKTITEESQIDDAVANVEGLLKVFQADNDRQRTEYATLKGQYDDLLKKSQQGGGGDPAKHEPNNDEPAWFTAYKKEQEERFNAIKAESDTLKAEKAKADRAALITSIANELGITEVRQKEGFFITDDMDEAGIRGYLGQVRQNQLDIEGKGKFPLAGSGKATKEEADAIVGSMKF